MAEGQKTVKKTFLSGVLLLSLSTVLVKVIGLIYKIPMLSYLGSEGMGYFNSAYEIYALFCVIATAGLPVALSVLISASIARGERRGAQKIYRASMAVFLLIGLIGTAVMVVFSPAFCRLIRSENAHACILSIAPTVFFICVSSALRGYFQGYQRMLPTAVSQLIEAVGKLVFGLLLARWALDRGYETPQVAAAAGVGLTLGTLVSMLYLVVEKLRFRPDGREGEAPETVLSSGTYRRIWADLGRLAIPMTLGASAVSLTKLIDMTMILRRLQAIGLSEAMANEAYGSYTTLALSVFGLLPALVNSVALPLVPILSAAIASGDRERQAQMIRSSYQLTALFAIPAALGVSAFARPILKLLFGGEPEAVAIAAPLLSILGVSVFLSCMITATNSVLHAYQSVTRPILSMLAGAAVKIAAAYFLIGIPSVGMIGAPVSTFLCNAVVVGMNLWFAGRLCKTPDLLPVFLRPLGAALGAVGLAYGGYLAIAARIGESTVLTLGSLLLCVGLYLLFACLFGVVSAEDILALPMGNKIYHVLVRLRLIRALEPAEKGRTI